MYQLRLREIMGRAEIDSAFELYTSMPFDEEEEISYVYDQRKHNEGRPEGNFEVFYNELDKMLEEYGKAAEERRQTSVAHLPLAVSVRQLIEKVKDRLTDKNVPIPSETTLRYQFMPGFANRKTSLNYKCRFDVISKIQRRQLRKFHMDAHYVNAYFLYLKNWCVENRSDCRLVCMDDKAKVPVGEPGTPEAATSHNRKALTRENIVNESADHNYHTSNLTPSVDFIVDIPDDVTKSFFTGNIYVGVKDSIFQPSDPLRHMVELLDVLRKHEDGIPPYLCLFSDGGGDHNITFLFVQCMLLALFKILDLDVLNVGRCAPNQSWINPAERCMSLLNIGMHGLALERDHTGPFEKVIGSAKSMKDVRVRAKKHQGLQETYQASLQSATLTLERCFQSMNLKGKPIQVFQPNRTSNEIIQTLATIEPIITNEESIPHHRPNLVDYPRLKMYFETHMNEGLYLLQFRKCGNTECCVKRNGELPPLVPSPVPIPGQDHYMPFHSLYGKVKTSEKDCPSLQQSGKDQKKKNQEGYKYLASKLVSVLDCHQCGKSRGIYCLKGQNGISTEGIRELDDIIFTCGMDLRTSTIYCGKLNCSSPIESTFYISRPKDKYVCYHCGSPEYIKDDMTQKMVEFSTVYPICMICKGKGKTQVLLNPKKNPTIKRGQKTISFSVVPNKKQCLVKPTSSEAPSSNKSTSSTKATIQATHASSSEGPVTPIDLTISSSKRSKASASKKSSSASVKASIKQTTLPSILPTRSKRVRRKPARFTIGEEDASSMPPEGETCPICLKEDDPSGRAAQVNWVDCDYCEQWVHTNCAKNSDWLHIRRDSWLCQDHKDHVTELSEDDDSSQ